MSATTTAKRGTGMTLISNEGIRGMSVGSTMSRASFPRRSTGLFEFRGDAVKPRTSLLMMLASKVLPAPVKTCKPLISKGRDLDQRARPFWRPQARAAHWFLPNLAKTLIPGVSPGMADLRIGSPKRANQRSRLIDRDKVLILNWFPKTGEPAARCTDLRRKGVDTTDTLCGPQES